MQRIRNRKNHAVEQERPVIHEPHHYNTGNKRRPETTFLISLLTHVLPLSSPFLCQTGNAIYTKLCNDIKINQEVASPTASHHLANP